MLLRTGCAEEYRLSRAVLSTRCYLPQPSAWDRAEHIAGTPNIWLVIDVIFSCPEIISWLVETGWENLLNVLCTSSCTKPEALWGSLKCPEGNSKTDKAQWPHHFSWHLCPLNLLKILFLCLNQILCCTREKEHELCTFPLNSSHPPPNLLLLSQVSDLLESQAGSLPRARPLSCRAGLGRS